jgi:galactonate dehydratase
MTVVRATPRTRWTFVEVEDNHGEVGVGEATLGGREEAVAAALERLARPLIGAAVDAHLPALLPEAFELSEAAARAALDQALWDLRARLDGQPVFNLLGGGRRKEVPLYANINRRTTDRSPAGFAQSARFAREAGFERIKIAPFDEVAAQADTQSRTLASRKGLERIAAVRDAIGHDADLLVDCHWRFDEASARQLIQDIAPYRIHWLECPIPESGGSIAALRRLRGAANEAGLRLAGNELGIGLEGFRPYLRAGAYDVMMPDVKYVGSLATVVDMAEEFEAHGVMLSPHNPSGPVCHVASLHVCAALPASPLLEVQLGESPVFQALVSPRLPPFVSGTSAVPAGRGWGIRFVRPGDHALVELSWRISHDGALQPVRALT